MAEVKNPDASEQANEESTKAKIAEAASAAKERMNDAAAHAKRRFSQAGGSMKSAASEARRKMGQVREKVSSADYGGMLSELRGYVRENPGKAIVIAAGIGFLVGLLLRDSEE